MRCHMRIILNLSFVIFLNQLNPPPLHHNHHHHYHNIHTIQPLLILQRWIHTHTQTLSHTHTHKQQEAESRRSERDLTMTLQYYTPTPSSSVEVTAQLADVLSVSYTDNSQLPIVSADVHRYKWWVQETDSN